MSKHKQRHSPPTPDELAKMQFLHDMVYHHDGGLGLIKRWHYDVAYDVCGGADLIEVRIGEFSWYEEDAALMEVDKHRAVGHTAYVTRSPDYTDSEIYIDKRRARTKYDNKDTLHRTRKKEPWYELPDDIKRISPYDHAHRTK